MYHSRLLAGVASNMVHSTAMASPLKPMDPGTLLFPLI